MLRLDIRGVNAYPLEKEVLTEGRVGLEISFTFSSDWDGLTKIAVFEGAQTIDVILVNDRCVVPHEALAQSGAALRIGVYGQNTAGDIVIPTVWAKFGMVQPAAVPSEVSSKPPTPSVVAQILSAAQNAESSASEAERIAQSVRDDADAGEFDGKDGVDGKDGSAIWQASAAPTHVTPGGGKPDFDYYLDSSLIGPSGNTPAVGDIVFYNSSYYPVTDHGNYAGIGVACMVGSAVSIKGDTGSTGPTGDSGVYIGASEPTDPDVDVWVDTSGDPDGETYTTAEKTKLAALSTSAQMPAGGSTGQVLKKISGTNYAAGWSNESVTSVDGKTGAVTILPSGGTSGDVLKKNSATDYDVVWAAESGGGSVDPYTSTPADLGTASAGSSDKYARGDHVHKKPTAADLGVIAAPGSPSAGDVLTYSSGAWAAAAPAHQIPSGGNAGECLAKNSATDYDLRWRTINDWTPAGLMRTNGGTAAKVAEWSFWSATQYPSWLVVTVGISNTYAGAITLKVNGSTAYPIYINGAASSATNYTLPAGSYFVYFDGSKFDFRTDGKIPGDITGHAADPTEVTVSTAGAVTQALDAGKIYHFTGALTALTITLNAASGLAHYHFDFDCGASAPTVTIPNTVTMPDSNSFVANKHYEVDILNNYGAVMAWANS